MLQKDLLGQKGAGGERRGCGRPGPGGPRRAGWPARSRSRPASAWPAGSPGKAASNTALTAGSCHQLASRTSRPCSSCSASISAVWMGATLPPWPFRMQNVPEAVLVGALQQVDDDRRQRVGPQAQAAGKAQVVQRHAIVERRRQQHAGPVAEPPGNLPRLPHVAGKGHVAAVLLATAHDQDQAVVAAQILGHVGPGQFFQQKSHRSPSGYHPFRASRSQVQSLLAGCTPRPAGGTR